jgi:hypothetical protein
MSFPRSRFAALFTALLLSFFAVAIYTPLHQHDAGNPYRCSLNNIDEAVAEAAVVIAVALAVLVRLAGVETERVLRPDFATVAPLAGRGPPSF